jgi:hypothetical protein
MVRRGEGGRLVDGSRLNARPIALAHAVRKRKWRVRHSSFQKTHSGFTVHMEIETILWPMRTAALWILRSLHPCEPRICGDVGGSCER